MTENEQSVFGLMQVASDQQKAIDKAIANLELEREAFVTARAEMLAATAEQLKLMSTAVGGVAEVAGHIKKAAEDAIPAISKAASAAAGSAVEKSLAGASETAANALEKAAAPILSGLTGVVRAGEGAADKLNAATKSFGWKWALVGGGTAVVFVIGVLGVTHMVTWSQRGTIADLKTQKVALQDDISQMQTSVANLERRGGRIVMTKCGERLCIEVSADQGKNAAGGPTALGDWQREMDKGGKVRLVIPNGY